MTAPFVSLSLRRDGRAACDKCRRCHTAGPRPVLMGMKPTPPTSTDLTFREMLEEVMDLAVGLGVGLLPLLLLAVPGIILFVVLPAIVLLLPLAALAAAGAVIAGPPYLLARLLRRRRPGARAHGLRHHPAHRLTICVAGGRVARWPRLRETSQSRRRSRRSPRSLVVARRSHALTACSGPPATAPSAGSYAPAACPGSRAAVPRSARGTTARAPGSSPRPCCRGRQPRKVSVEAVLGLPGAQGPDRRRDRRTAHPSGALRAARSTVTRRRRPAVRVRAGERGKSAG